MSDEMTMAQKSAKVLLLAFYSEQGLRWLFFWEAAKLVVVLQNVILLSPSVQEPAAELILVLVRYL